MATTAAISVDTHRTQIVSPLDFLFAQPRAKAVLTIVLSCGVRFPLVSSPLLLVASISLTSFLNSHLSPPTQAESVIHSEEARLSGGSECSGNLASF